MALNATHNTKIILSAEDKTKGAFASAEKNLNGLVGEFSKFRGVAAGGLFAVLAGGLIKIAQETSNAQAEQAQLGAVLRSTGEAAGFSRDQLNKMADDLSRKSVFAAGDITNAQTRLLSYTGIVGQQFPKAMQATIDMAQRMGMSVESSAETIGKALDIPSEGLTALTRQGFRFTEAQKALVKEFEATNRTADAQDIILKALETSYGDAAAAARDTMGGAVSGLKNSFDDLFEASDSGGRFFITIVQDMTLAVDGLSAAMRGVPFDYLNQRLPNYKKFREQMDKEFGPPAGTFTPSNEGLILPRNATIGGSGPSLREQIEQRAARFTEANKLNDAVAKQAEYTAKLREINDLEREGGLSAELAARYRAQLHDQTFKAAAATGKLSEAERARDKIEEEVRKNIEATTEARTRQLLSMDELVQAEYAAIIENTRQLEIMRVGEGVVIRMEAARLMEAAAAAEQGLEYAKMNGLSAENIAFTEAAIQKTRELADARLKSLTSRESKEAFELEQKRIEDLAKAQQDAIKENELETRRAAESMNQSLTDALFRGFEDGLGFLENFRKTAINAFKTLILRPTVSFLTAPLTNALAAGGVGLGASGTASAGGFFEALTGSGSNSLLGGISNLSSAINGTLVGSIETFGSGIASYFGADSVLGNLGGMLGQYSQTIATALPFAGAGIQALMGDVKGAAFTAAGAALGSFIPGIGTAIGGAIGGLVGGLFGGSGEKYKQIIQQRTGVFDGSNFSTIQGQQKRAPSGLAGGLDGLNETFARNLSTLLGEFGLSQNVSASSYTRLRRTSGRTAGQFAASFAGGSVNFGGRDWQFGGKGDIGAGFTQFAARVLGEGLSKAIQSSALPDGIRALFAGITDQTAVVNMINATVNLSNAQEGLADRFGLTVNEAAKVSMQLGHTGEGLVKFINDFAMLSNSLTTVGKQLITARTNLEDSYGGALPASIKSFDEALKAIDTTTQAGIANFAEFFALRPQFEAFQSTIDGLKGNVRGAIFSMVSDSEQIAMQREDMNRIFTELGYAVPGSIQELVAMGKSIDFTTEAGLNLAAVFPTLVQAFNAVNQSATQLNNTLNPDRFRTFADFMIASAFTRNGIPLSQLPAANMPAYADGGFHSGGLRLVGERGPEIEATGPSRIYSAEQTRSMLSGDNRQMVAELRALRREVEQLRRETASAADGSQRSARQLEDMASGDVVLMTEVAA